MVYAQSDDTTVLKITRILNATRQEVFAAWTDPASVKQWLCPEEASVVRVELDVRVGGAFRIDMQDQDDYVIHTGIYREIKPPERLVFTWVSKYTQHRETLVTVELFERVDKTELVLTQVQLPNEEARQRHAFGWTSIVAHLATYMENKLKP
jgi:uncharacterized protein YndB with AHSA1/START domain